MPQLSFPQRAQIERLLQKEKTLSAIAREVGVHRSTIKRELERNSVKGEYLAEAAQSRSKYRKGMAGFVSQIGVKRPKYPVKRSYRFRTKYSFRLKRYYRKDSRPYFLHPNGKRSEWYCFWKKRYERIYRWRDYRLAEYVRGYRSMDIFNSYAHFRICPMLRRHRRQERQFNRMKREDYFRKIARREFKEMNERLDRVEELLLESIKKEEKPAQEEELPVQLPALVLLFLLKEWQTPRTASIWLRARAGPLIHAPPGLPVVIFLLKYFFVAAFSRAIAEPSSFTDWFICPRFFFA